MRRRRWRFYKTVSGAAPVRAFLDKLSGAEAESKAFRVLFSLEGRFQQVPLALEAFTKKTQKMPARTMELAERRLADWRSRGRGRGR